MRLRPKLTDYPFLISIGGIGGLTAAACFIFGLAIGWPTVGYLLSSLCLLVAAGMIGKCLYDGCEIPLNVMESPSAVKTTQPYAITSIEGALVHCNEPYRNFLKEGIKRDVVSPLDVMEEEQKFAVMTAINQLEVGSKDSKIIQLLSGNNEQKYVEVILSRKKERAGYIGWTFSGVTPNVPFEPMKKNENGFNIEQLGRILDGSNRGLLAVSEGGNIIYANDILLYWLTGESEEALRIPLPLSQLCSDIPKNLKGQIKIQTLSGDDILLDFTPLEIASDHMKNPYSYEVLGHQAQVYQVVFHLSESVINESDGDNINIDRFFRESPIGIAIVTEQGNVLERNNVFREYVKDLDIKNSRSLRLFIKSDEYDDLHARIKKTLDTGLASSIPDMGFKGKIEKHAHIYMTPLNKFGDHDRVVILYIIDTTEQKSLELQFAQSQKMQAVGQLAGGVAHDFNNLLTAIIGFSDLLLVRHGPGDQSFSDIIQIKQNANRAANLVRQLLAFSRQQTLRPKVLILTDVLAELSNLLGRLIGDSIELDFNHGRGLGQVKVDQGQLEQVIINLCVNARDAMDNQGKITIRTRNISLKQSKKVKENYPVMPLNEYVLLEVEDTGCGIPKENLDKIFEPFFSTKEVGKGTGLGLSTVYGIVKQTDGFVFPASVVGKGTTFSIYLPVYKESDKEFAKKETAIPVPEKNDRDLTGKGTILLVEDEDAVRMFAARALKNKGYNLYEADSGETALALFEDIEDELDLIISDVIMPLMDGPTMVRKIRETNDRIKVIFISGYAEEAFEKSPEDDDFHFLPKPFSLKQLAERVKEVLEEG